MTVSRHPPGHKKATFRERLCSLFNYSTLPCSISFVRIVDFLVSEGFYVWRAQTPKALR